MSKSVLAVLAFGLAVLSAGGAWAQGAAAGDPGRGRGLFEANGCQACHGPAGAGGGAGPALAGAPLTFAGFERQLRAPTGRMPPYALPARDVADLWAYVKAQAAPKKTAAAAPPPGDPVRGKSAYLANGCHNCHGSVGQGGGPGPRLARTKLSYQGFAHQLRRPAGSMPAYAEPLMTDQDLADAYAYLESLPGPRTGKDIPAILTRR